MYDKEIWTLFLFIYADSTLLVVPGHLLFCSPVSSCVLWTDAMQNKRVSPELALCSDNAVVLATCLILLILMYHHRVQR